MLEEILEKLKVILRSEKLYGPLNPSIIMCDSDLEIPIKKLMMGVPNRV